MKQGFFKKLKSNRLQLLAVIVAALLILDTLTLALIYAFKSKDKVSAPKADTEVQKILLGDVEASDAVITQFYIYGSHLHLEGEVDEALYPGFVRMGLVLRNSSEKDTEIVLECTREGGKIRFQSSRYINSGICLDELAQGDYCVLFRIVTDSKKVFVSAKEESDYPAVNYYTVTKNGRNNLVNIGFTRYSTGKKTLNCLAMRIEEAALPDDVYDVVIDAGHGGADSGAVYKGYRECDFTIEYAKALKKSLEGLGLKVKMTRNGDEKPDKMTSAASYCKDGRVERANLSGAKYCFCVHFNATAGSKTTSAHGLQIYCAYGDDTAFADSMVKSITQSAGIQPSAQEFCRVGTGVYIRTFGKTEIARSKEIAKKYGYEPYNIPVDRITYYFMLRETGGVATGAYIDGRSAEFNHDENESRNSVTGLETYLLELGYINNDGDLALIINNRDAYIKGLTQAIAKELGIKTDA